MAHNESERRFIIDTDDSKTEETVITVTSIIEYYTDYTQTSKDSLTESFTFILSVENLFDCTVTTLDFSLDNMITHTHDDEVYQSLPVV